MPIGCRYILFISISGMSRLAKKEIDEFINQEQACDLADRRFDCTCLSILSNREICRCQNWVWGMWSTNDLEALR